MRETYFNRACSVSVSSLPRTYRRNGTIHWMPNSGFSLKYMFQNRAN